MSSAYLNALSEEKNPEVLFEQICKLYDENVKLREAALRELQRLGQEWDNDDAEQRHGANVADQRHGGDDE